MVRSRQRPTMSSPSKAPMVTFELPTSSARSIGLYKCGRPNPASQNGGLRSIIFAHPQEPRRIEPAGDAFESCDACIHPHALSENVARSVCELPQDFIGAKPCIAIY